MMNERACLTYLVDLILMTIGLELEEDYVHKCHDCGLIA